MYLIYSTRFMAVHVFRTFREEAHTRRLFIPHQATNHFELLQRILGPVLLQEWKNVCHFEVHIFYRRLVSDFYIAYWPWCLLAEVTRILNYCTQASTHAHTKRIAKLIIYTITIALVLQGVRQVRMSAQTSS